MLQTLKAATALTGMPPSNAVKSRDPCTDSAGDDTFWTGVCQQLAPAVQPSSMQHGPSILLGNPETGHGHMAHDQSGRVGLKPQPSSQAVLCNAEACRLAAQVIVECRLTTCTGDVCFLYCFIPEAGGWYWVLHEICHLDKWDGNEANICKQAWPMHPSHRT